jgi:tRNA (cytidine/uridine-2'-O-)-methyltransferase
MLQIALYQPEIPQNVGTILRLAACMQVSVHLIEPFGFIWNEPKMRRAGMDYLDKVRIIKHDSWPSFLYEINSKKLILLDVKGENSIYEHKFSDEQILLVGRESDGVPTGVAANCYSSINIPMPGEGRSLNVAVATAMTVSEAYRQLS